MPQLSVIIPTLNEEKYISKLLTCLEKQSFRDFEVIVVDGNSKDRTREVARNFRKLKPKIIIAQKRGIGRARNIGARLARGDILFFLDADTTFNRNFLRTCSREFEYRYVDVATVRYAPRTKKLLDKALYGIGNTAIKTLERIAPMAQGICIIATRRIHNRIKGFDETIKLGEDVNYVERAGKLGKFRVLASAKINFSVRRFEKEGRAKLIAKYLINDIYRIFGKEVRGDFLNYTFGDYDKNKITTFQRMLKKTKKKLRVLQRKIEQQLEIN